MRARTFSAVSNFAPGASKKGAQKGAGATPGYNGRNSGIHDEHAFSFFAFAWLARPLWPGSVVERRSALESRRPLSPYGLSGFFDSDSRKAAGQRQGVLPDRPRLLYVGRLQAGY